VAEHSVYSPRDWDFQSEIGGRMDCKYVALDLRDGRYAAFLVHRKTQEWWRLVAVFSTWDRAYNYCDMENLLILSQADYDNNDRDLSSVEHEERSPAPDTLPADLASGLGRIETLTSRAQDPAEVLPQGVRGEFASNSYRLTVFNSYAAGRNLSKGVEQISGTGATRHANKPIPAPTAIAELPPKPLEAQHGVADDAGGTIYPNAATVSRSATATSSSPRKKPRTYSVLNAEELGGAPRLARFELRGRPRNAIDAMMRLRKQGVTAVRPGDIPVMFAGFPRGSVFATLDALAKEGYVERLDNGRWRLLKDAYGCALPPLESPGSEALHVEKTDRARSEEETVPEAALLLAENTDDVETVSLEQAQFFLRDCGYSVRGGGKGTFLIDGSPATRDELLLQVNLMRRAAGMPDWQLAQTAPDTLPAVR
jgi:hypothetical protein